MRDKQGQRIAIWAALAAGLFVMGACAGDNDRTAGNEDPALLVSTHEPVDLNWEEDWKPALQRAEAESKVVLVDFYADWCLWCKRLETTTFADPKVGAYLAGNVVPLKLDVEGAGEELSEKYEVDGLPTIVVMTADGSELGRIVGYMSPTSFLGRLEEILATS